MTEIIEPGANVTAHGYLGTVIAYDTSTNSYTVEIVAPAAAVHPIQALEPRELGVYKLSLIGGGDLVAQKVGSGAWVLMGDGSTYTWPPVKRITDWERIT